MELVEAIELADAAQQQDAGERAPPFPRRVIQEWRAPKGTQRPLSRPEPPSPRDEPMPTEAPARTWLAGCIVQRDLPAGAPEVDVKINGKPFRAILDSGSAFSLVQSHLLSPRMEYKTFLPITCVHGDTQQVPARRMTISAVTGTWPVEVGVVKDLPVPVLIGRDWPVFDRLLAMTTQPASPRRDRRRRKPTKGPRQRPVLLASDSRRDGESPSQNPNLFYDVFQQVTGGGSFGKEQREDDRLKHCWTQVRIIEGKEAQPGPHPLPHFVVQNGLLYCVARRRKNYCWWCPAQRRRPYWSWHIPIPWQGTSEPRIPANGSATASIGRDWKLRWRGFAKPARPAKLRHPGHLPPARWYRSPSSRCLLSAWLSTMPPGIQRQFPSEKPPRKPLPRNSSCYPAESASQRKSWPIKVPSLCPG